MEAEARRAVPKGSRLPEFHDNFMRKFYPNYKIRNHRSSDWIPVERPRNSVFPELQVRVFVATWGDISTKYLYIMKAYSVEAKL